MTVPTGFGTLTPGYGTTVSSCIGTPDGPPAAIRDHVDAPERGQVTVFVSALLVVVVLCLVATGRIATAAVDRARAQQAADAAALAAAVRVDPLDGDRVAALVADANGAVVDGIRRVDRTVVVTVRIASARATAAARPVWRTP